MGYLLFKAIAGLFKAIFMLPIYVIRVFTGGR